MILKLPIHDYANLITTEHISEFGPDDRLNWKPESMKRVLSYFIGELLVNASDFINDTLNVELLTPDHLYLYSMEHEDFNPDNISRLYELIDYNINAYIDANDCYDSFVYMDMIQEIAMRYDSWLSDVWRVLLQARVNNYLVKFSELDFSGINVVYVKLNYTLAPSQITNEHRDALYGIMASF